MAARLEVGAQRGVIVELAVEDDGGAACGIEDGLIAALQIDCGRSPRNSAAHSARNAGAAPRASG